SVSALWRERNTRVTAWNRVCSRLLRRTIDSGCSYIGRRGANPPVTVQRLGKLLRDHRLLSRGADGSAIRGGRARRRGALDRPGGGSVWHAHSRPLLRCVAHVGDPERALAGGLARRPLAR